MAAQVETTSQQGGGGGGGGGAGDPSETHADVNSSDNTSVDEIEKTRTLICALNFLSRNLPLPQDVFDAVSSIYHDGGAADTAAEEENNQDDNGDDNDGEEEEEEAEREVNNQNDDSNVVVGGGGVGSSAGKATVKVSNFSSFFI